MEFQVKVMPRAQKDINALYRWVVQQAPLQGTIWYEGLINAMCSLNRFPMRCSMAPEAKDSGRAIRHLIYGKNHFRILFEVLEKEVRVVHVRRSKQNYWNFK